MTILLNSLDSRIIQICRRVLEALPPKDRSLICGFQGEVDLRVDLYIWDVDNTTDLPEFINSAQEYQHIFLIRRQQLSALRERFPNPSYAVLLKPVTEGSFRSFVEQALARCDSMLSDRSELLQFLLEANMRLQEYDQERTNFLARGIHDFRAPLTALNGYCGLLLDEQLGPVNPCQAEVLDRMRHSMKRLSRMADAMFELSIGTRVDRNLQLHESDIELSINCVVQELAPLFHEKRIDLSIDLNASPEPLHFEPSQIEQVLINILDNACKFTPRHGSVVIRGYPFFWDRRSASVIGMTAVSERRTLDTLTPNCYRIDIRDSGPGIPAGQDSFVFEEYTSCSGDQDRSGGGLGLAICKLILARHHGRVWAESNGEGATFSLVLPFVRDQASRASRDSEMEVVVSAG